jgi:hypothetical protein
MMIHSHERNFVCTLCPKTFIFNFDLNRHRKTHALQDGNNGDEKKKPAKKATGNFFINKLLSRCLCKFLRKFFWQ